MSRPSPTIASLTADQRRATLAVLEQLSVQDWQRPSMCEGWTIHQVVAHLTLPYTSRRSRVLAGLIKSRGNFDEAADAMARADARQYPPEQLIDICRTHIDHPWNPPGGGPTGALSHDVIHSYDITDALGLPTTVTPERARVVLRAFKPVHLKGFGTDLKTTHVAATDDDVAFGAPIEDAERVVQAALLDLIPILTGRRTAPASERPTGSPTN